MGLARPRGDPALIPAAVEELPRYVIISGSGFVPLARVTREEVEAILLTDAASGQPVPLDE